jgi:hypothetical protein
MVLSRAALRKAYRQTANLVAVDADHKLKEPIVL